MSRKDFFDDPAAPAANSLVPGVSAIVANDARELVLQRRTDNDLWALPGGVMDIGESIAAALVREVQEETGLDVEPFAIVGVYSDPRHVFAYSDGEVRQELSICFACRIVGGRLAASDESHEVAFVAPDRLSDLDMHPSIALRIRHYLERRPQPFIG